MALRYRILPEAKRELVDAAAYHEQQREGLGLKLFDEYDAVIEHAREFPDSGKRIDLGADHEVRCFQVRRFRYSVFAAMVADQLVVFCISHHKRRPGYWAERLRRQIDDRAGSRVKLPNAHLLHVTRSVTSDLDLQPSGRSACWRSSFRIIGRLAGLPKRAFMSTTLTLRPNNAIMQDRPVLDRPLGSPVSGRFEKAASHGLRLAFAKLFLARAWSSSLTSCVAVARARSVASSTLWSCASQPQCVEPGNGRGFGT